MRAGMNRISTDASAERLSRSEPSPRVHDGEHCSWMPFHIDGSRVRQYREILPDILALSVISVHTLSLSVNPH